MKTAVMTDTNSGIDFAEADKLNIFVVPMPVIIDGNTYYEGINIDEESFYRLQTEKNITTSQPAPGAVTEIWDHILQTYDELIYIPMSSGLSSTVQTAKMLADDYDGKVVVCDNHRISVLLRDSVLQAAKMAEQGYSAQMISDYLEEHQSENTIYIVVDTLEYLKRGGRITAAAAALGTVLSVKPILSIQGEKLEAFAKCRGLRKAQEKMIEAMKNDLETRYAGFSNAQLTMHTAGSGLDDQTRDNWVNMVQSAFPQFTVDYSPLSLSIGAHVGPMALGIGVSVTDILTK